MSPPEQKYGVDDLMLAMLGSNQAVYVERYPGYWLDIGRVDDYLRAVEEFDETQQTTLAQ